MPFDTSLLRKSPIAPSSTKTFGVSVAPDSARRYTVVNNLIAAKGDGARADMTDITSKDYIDARIEAAQAKGDARFAELMGEMRSMRSDMDAKFSGIIAEQRIQSAKMETLSQVVLDAKSAARKAEAAAERAEDSAKNTKWNIAITAIAVVGVMFAGYQLYVGGVQATTGIVQMVQPSQ